MGALGTANLPLSARALGEVWRAGLRGSGRTGQHAGRHLSPHEPVRRAMEEPAHELRYLKLASSWSPPWRPSAPTGVRIPSSVSWAAALLLS